MKTKVLVIDSTGRGHALCDLFVRTDASVHVYYGPGCDVISHPRITPLKQLSLTDSSATARFLELNPVDFVFVSNIDALSRGFVDDLRRLGHRVIGPSKAAAELESSKEAGKAFCRKYGLKTASYRSFTDREEAIQYVNGFPSESCVIKFDGLTPNGDGAVVCYSKQRAVDAISRLFDENSGSCKVIVEELLRGEEISVFALVDGKDYLLFPTAKDYKRALEKDQGGNCDGMGSLAPHPAQNSQLLKDIRRELLDPFIAGVRAESWSYTGFIYIGAMITDHSLRVIELNARFGDSEAEVVLPAVTSNFTSLCFDVLNQTLPNKIETDGLNRVSVALVQGYCQGDDQERFPGWPFGSFNPGQRIKGLEDGNSSSRLFYGGLTHDEQGEPISRGGRVLHVVGEGKSVGEARTLAYGQVGRISFKGMKYRADIGDVK